MTSYSSIARQERASTRDDGQAEDFDWELGTWHTSVRVLADPLSDTRAEGAGSLVGVRGDQRRCGR